MDIALQLLFTGIGIGAVYALVALGFVLIFRATNVVNFAQGEFSMVAAYLMVVFAVDLGWPYWISFLVSLALALGLASLSSNRVRVESLFIDEGFGSLDSETLRVAMDALDGLQSMGRKVGVISHVQEMTERIATKILVQPTAGGRSTVRIE